MSWGLVIYVVVVVGKVDVVFVVICFYWYVCVGVVVGGEGWYCYVVRCVCVYVGVGFCCVDVGCFGFEVGGFFFGIVVYDFVCVVV